MKLLMKKLLILLIAIINATSSLASHESGFTITLKYIGQGNEYLLKYDYYRDCSGIAAPLNYKIYYDLNGGLYDSAIVNYSQLTTWNSTLCLINNPLNCAGGFGYELITYIDTISLPDSGLYRFYRNTAEPQTTSTTVPPVNYYYVETYLLVQPGLNNSLPDFTSNPEFHLCLGVPVNIHTNASEPDADSVAYSIVSLMTFDTILNMAINYPYTPPNNQNTFLLMLSPPASIDSISGVVSFTPMVIALGAMAIKADEYRNGSWIGSVMREYTLQVTATGINIGVMENEDKELVVYPNPATDYLFNSLKTIGAPYTIHNSYGKVIQTGITDGDRINVNKLIPGMYFLNLKIDKDTKSVRFVKF